MTETLTDKVKQELAATSITRQSARAAELTAVLRFAGEVTVPGYGPVSYTHLTLPTTPYV